MISVWKEDRIQRMIDGTCRDSKNQKIAARMNDLGVERTPAQIKRKMRLLRAAYKTANDNNNRSGRGRKICEFHDELHEILGGRLRGYELGAGLCLSGSRLSRLNALSMASKVAIFS